MFLKLKVFKLKVYNCSKAQDQARKDDTEVYSINDLNKVINDAAERRIDEKVTKSAT